jgi:hypothetical protein
MREERHTEIYAGDKMIEMDTNNGDIKILQKNPNETKVYLINLSLENEDEALEEITHFLSLLQKANAPSDPVETGIFSHLTAMEIIHEIIPYPIEKTRCIR